MPPLRFTENHPPCLRQTARDLRPHCWPAPYALLLLQLRYYYSSCALCSQLAEEPSFEQSERLRAAHATVERIVSALLRLAVSDLDAGVRRAAAECFRGTVTRPATREGSAAGSLIMFFAQASATRALTLCLNDPSAPVRVATLTVLGHLVASNPAAAFPVLRRHLHQLLADIQHGPDSKRLDEAALLLAEMVEQVRLRSALQLACCSAQLSPHNCTAARCEMVGVGAAWADVALASLRFAKICVNHLSVPACRRHPLCPMPRSSSLLHSDIWVWGKR